MTNCHISFWLSASSAGRQKGAVSDSAFAQGKDRWQQPTGLKHHSCTPL